MQCAKRGSPTGGPIDELPPVILRAYPENYSTNFTASEIVIQFDEYVTFKDLNKQLVISPPMEYPPIILPQGGVGREITIRIQDTLKENATYMMNFGQSLVDNNEANPYPFFKYVFSTGSYIDSLTLNGRIKNVLEYETSDYVNVLLYEVDSTYTDSAIYNDNPDYILNTLDSLENFTFENLREGTYRMVALKEENSDYRFNPKRDMIGFYPNLISVPSDSVYEIKLYRQTADPLIRRAYHKSRYAIEVGYEGVLDSMDIEPINSTLITESRITRLNDTDSLQYWFKNEFKADTVEFKASLRDFEEIFEVRIKDSLPIDTLAFNSSSKEFTDRTKGKTLALPATTPLENIDMSKVTIIDRDSIPVEATSTINKLRNYITFNFTKEESQIYQAEILPGAVEDFFGATNKDTLRLKMTTKKNRDFGNIFLDLQGGTNFPVIVQVVDSKLTVIEEQIATENGPVNFELLNPSEYLIRIIYDENANSIYDPGNALLNRQPERVEYLLDKYGRLPKKIKLLSNWDIVETINLD